MMNKIIYILFLFVSLSADIMIDQLINKTHNIGWYMFRTTGDLVRTYLVNNRDSGNIDDIRVWNFTSERKWRPISNARGFDGFTGAAKNFTSISISGDGKEVIFGDKAISKNIPIDTYLNDLVKKTFKIQWYYWITDNGFPFLAYNRDSAAGLSIYQHIANGKWKPIHNAKAFDNYPTAKSVFSKVSMSDDGRTIDIVYSNFNMPTIKGVLPRETLVEDFRMSSNDFSDEDYKNGKTYTWGANPHIDWTNAPDNAKSLAIEAINLGDKKAIWRAINIKPGDSNSSYIPSGAEADYNGITTLENDYNFEKEFYDDTSTPKGDYLILLYALSVETTTSMKEAKQYSVGHVKMLFKAP